MRVLGTLLCAALCVLPLQADDWQLWIDRLDAPDPELREAAQAQLERTAQAGSPEQRFALAAKVDQVLRDGGLSAETQLRLEALGVLLERWVALVQPQFEAARSEGLPLHIERAGIELSLIPAGSFVMGSPLSEPGRNPSEVQHEVTLSRSFYLARTEVTQGLWREINAENPAAFDELGDDAPVESITWYDAVAFCNALSEREGLPRAYRIDNKLIERGRILYAEVELIAGDAQGFRLPSEAQWEYACRAGTTTPYWTGESLSASQARLSDSPVAVGSYAPNPWGLFDMHGNVWEWCWDAVETYAEQAATDPLGAAQGSRRAIRGGSWLNDVEDCRSASRWMPGFPPDDFDPDVGLRLVLPALPLPSKNPDGGEPSR